MPAVQGTRPTVKVRVSPDCGREETLRQLQYGIEEEGIPFDLEVGGAADAMALAWQASQESRLEVGLGLDREELVLQFGKLRPDRPLFRISARSPEWQIRAMGANAARLVKKLPFKPME